MSMFVALVPDPTKYFKTESLNTQPRFSYMGILLKDTKEWSYGICHNSVARRHKTKGNVQFVLWNAGEQGHTEDFWHDMNTYWWSFFIPQHNKSACAAHKKNIILRLFNKLFKKDKQCQE